jgi:hypothetical protein
VSFGGSRPIRSVTERTNRGFVEGSLWSARTGAPWRDLPAEFGNWNRMWRRSRRWADRGVWVRILEHVSEDPDLDGRACRAGIEIDNVGSIERNGGAVAVDRMDPWPWSQIGCSTGFEVGLELDRGDPAFRPDRLR